MNVGMDVKPTEASKPLYFYISYHQLYQHGGNVNIWVGSYTSPT
jgi:hypothetical protein